jgi:hypothetical protein
MVNPQGGAPELRAGGKIELISPSAEMQVFFDRLGKRP